MRAYTKADAEAARKLNGAPDVVTLRRSDRPLTERQRLVLAFIVGEIERNTRPPTLREIGRHLGISSTNGVNDHLMALERKGHLTRDTMLSRGIYVTELGRRTVLGDKIVQCCPTCGKPR